MKKLLILLLIIFSITLISCEVDLSLVDTSMFEKEAEVYTVSFDTDGGTEVDSLSVTEGLSAKRPKNPTKDGYDFGGWYNEDGEKYLFYQTAITSDTTIYAKWLPLQTVNFVTDFGEIPQNQKIGYGKYATEPTITYEGYYIEYWYDEYDNQWSFEDFPIKRDITLTAKWNKSVKVSVNDETIYLISGQTLPYLIEPKKSGAYFIGWYRSNEDNALEKVDENTQFFKDTTLIPKWEENENVILITLNQGEGYLKEEKRLLLSEKGSRLTNLPEPTSIGNSYFLGWYDENGVRYSKNSILYEDITLTAKYQFRTECEKNENKLHRFTHWDYDPAYATCTEDAKSTRYCLDCGKEEVEINEDALGHRYNNSWTYSFMKKSRTCYVCNFVQEVDFTEIKDTVGYATISGEVYGADNVNCLFNGVWDEENKNAFCGKNGTPVTVTIKLKNPTTANGIYIQGTGATSVSILVKYQGDTDFSLVGFSYFDSTPVLTLLQNTPITEIQLVMTNSGEGTSLWQEVALVKIPLVF